MYSTRLSRLVPPPSTGVKVSNLVAIQHALELQTILTWSILQTEAMHDALQNRDVIGEIATYLTKGSLAALACTSKHVCDRALDELWRVMVSLGPLYQCLPSGVCTKDSGGKMVRYRSCLFLTFHYCNRMTNRSLEEPLPCQMTGIDSSYMRSEFASSP